MIIIILFVKLLILIATTEYINTSIDSKATSGPAKLHQGSGPRGRGPRIDRLSRELSWCTAKRPSRAPARPLSPSHPLSPSLPLPLSLFIRKTDSIRHHHPEGVVYRSCCFNSSTVAVSEIVSRRRWCTGSLFPFTYLSLSPSLPLFLSSSLPLSLSLSLHPFSTLEPSDPFPVLPLRPSFLNFCYSTKDLSKASSTSLYLYLCLSLSLSLYIYIYI